jgi:hypothetical protein
MEHFNRKMERFGKGLQADDALDGKLRDPRRY